MLKVPDRQSRKTQFVIIFDGGKRRAVVHVWQIALTPGPKI